MDTKEKPSQLLSARGFASVALHVDLTPAGWTKGGTLLEFSGPCLSPASWSALQKVGVPPFPHGQTGRQWFWPLLPKQKWLGCRAETRHLI